MNYFRALLTNHTHRLFLPEKWKDDIQRYVQRQQKGSARNPEVAPFERQLDFWALALVTAVARGVPRERSRPSDGGHRFADTRSVEMSDELCELLAVITLGELGLEHDDVGDPGRIIEIGNQYAAAGCEELLVCLRNPDLRLSTLDKIMDFVSEWVVAMHAVDGERE